MTVRALPLTKAMLAAAAALALQGCITIQAIEPVIEPPAQFKGDVTVPVEFAMPGAIGFRCAERGAKFLGLPGINSGACATPSLVTMIDPCATVTAGGYAKAFCDGLNVNREESTEAEQANDTTTTAPVGLVKIGYTPKAAPARQQPVAASERQWRSVPVEFMKPEFAEMRCAERGAKMFDAGEGIIACADRMLITMTNPCSVEDSGWYARTLCHELAHANRWPADHPAHYGHSEIKMASQSPQALALLAKQAEEAPATEMTQAPALLPKAESQLPVAPEARVVPAPKAESQSFKFGRFKFYEIATTTGVSDLVRAPLAFLQKMTAGFKPLNVERETPAETAGASDMADISSALRPRSHS